MIERIWYGHSCFAQLLWPFSWMYRFVFAVRRWIIRQFFRQKHRVPVITVGNLTVGGTGKTPLVIAIVQFLQQKGLRVGIVSRGYRSHATQFPYLVNSQSPVNLSGDEPLLIATKTKAPVVISPNRNEAVKYFTEKKLVDVILSDDGLQHDAMESDIEIVVVDGRRGFGNGYCLPAGPLREPVSRLKSCDFVVINEEGEQSLSSPGDLCGLTPVFLMTLQPKSAINLQTDQECDISVLAEPLTAVAGIGNPARFFNTLKQLGIVFKPRVFPDHHVFTEDDFHGLQNKIVMTEKDAVKCRSFARSNWYCLPVEARLPDDFWAAFHARVRALA